MPGVRVLEPGLLTTVQDAGRWGYQNQGLRVQGAVDPFAYALANLLVGNPAGAAVLEVTLLGPQLRAQQDLVIAVTGGDLGPAVDGHPVPTWQSVAVPAGARIHFGPRRSGCRAYLAVAGGWDVPAVLGSRSTCLVSGWDGLAGRALRTGDELPVGAPSGPLAQLAGREIVPEARPPFTEDITLRVILGPQDDAFTEAGIATLLAATYTVSRDADRMGCRLEGPPLQHRGRADIYSEGIAWGAIQVPANGQPIILLAGRQGVGGYTKVAGVIAADLSLIAQARPGDRVRFRAVSLEEGHAALAAQRRWVGPAGVRPVGATTAAAVPELLRACARYGFRVLDLQGEGFHLRLRQ